MSPFDPAGAIAAGYEHVSKLVQPGAAVSLAGGLLKWYEIATAERPVPAEIAELARQALPDVAPSLSGELGFVILHRCGESFYFLLLSTWRNENELWETVGQARRARAGILPVAARGGPPPDLLRLGIARGLP